jgi:hypothetical protein
LAERNFHLGKAALLRGTTGRSCAVQLEIAWQ